MILFSLGCIVGLLVSILIVTALMFLRPIIEQKLDPSIFYRAPKTCALILIEKWGILSSMSGW